VYKLMAGRSVECPLCLEPAFRPTVTQCVHVFCLACILDLIRREGGAAKCPVCRRPVQVSQLMEVVSENFAEEQEVEMEIRLQAEVEANAQAVAVVVATGSSSSSSSQSSSSSAIAASGCGNGSNIHGVSAGSAASKYSFE
jgi:uncharacterized Zn finger protein (UPF0148 family)